MIILILGGLWSLTHSGRPSFFIDWCQYLQGERSILRLHDTGGLIILRHMLRQLYHFEVIWIRLAIRPRLNVFGTF